MSKTLIESFMNIHCDTQGARPTLDLPKSPIIGETNFIISKIEEKRDKLYPRWDEAREGSAWLAKAHARRYLLDITKTLFYKRIILEKKRVEFDKKWKDIGFREETLRVTFIKFNAFVKENIEKRQRARRKVDSEIDLQNRRDAEVECLKQNFQFMSSIKSMMEERIKEYKMYENYLQSVVINCPSFYKNINDVIFRYESLMHMKQYLARSQQEGLEALENARSELAKLMEVQALKNVGLQNRLARMQERYDTAYQKSMMWESVVEQVQEQCTNLMATLQQIRVSCRSVYLQMCKRKNVEPTAQESDHEGQLMMIKKTLLDLSNVVEKTKTGYTSMTKVPTLAALVAKASFTM